MQYGGSTYTQFLCSFFLNFAFYEIILKSTAVQAAADNIIWRVRLACSITSATDTHPEYVMLIAAGYMTALSVTLDLNCCRVKISRVSKPLN
jgi:hypothetical protein